jgi:hypothetical protein
LWYFDCKKSSNKQDDISSAGEVYRRDAEVEARESKREGSRREREGQRKKETRRSITPTTSLGPQR